MNSHSNRKPDPAARSGHQCLNAAGVRAPLSPHASLAPEPGKDAFHHVPDFGGIEGDAMEPVLTKFSLEKAIHSRERSQRSQRKGVMTDCVFTQQVN